MYLRSDNMFCSISKQSLILAQWSKQISIFWVSKLMLWYDCLVNVDKNWLLSFKSKIDWKDLMGMDLFGFGLFHIKSAPERSIYNYYLGLMLDESLTW